MFRSYLSAALGNLARNWLYAGVTILGLAVSFAAAIVIGLYVRDEFSFDRFIPDHQRIYRLAMDINLPGRKPFSVDQITGMVADQFRLDFPEVERTARLELHSIGVRRGELEAVDPIAWADPSFFQLMPMPVLAGDPTAALAAPDGLVLTREMARKYFGEDAPIGKTLQVSTTLNLEGGPPDWFAPRVMRVLAVLKDPPESSHINVGIYGSGRAAISLLALDDAHPSVFNSTTYTYVKLKPGASAAAAQARLPAFANRHFPSQTGGESALRFRLEPLTDLHFTSRNSTPGLRPPGDRTVDLGIGAVGILIIVIAAINFITLMTARATRRAVEVGVRKAVGAGRRDLIVQFMGEALIYVLIAMVIGVSLAELALPYANALVGRTLRFGYLDDPRLLAAILGTAAITTLLAGGYPALVISSFRPATALKGGVGQRAGSAAVRQSLVIVQFAILIGLIVMTGTIYRQTSFALNDAMRLDTDQVLRINAPCEPAMKHEVAAIPGVKQVACVSQVVVMPGSGENNFAMQPGHTQVTVELAAVDVGFFEMHGLKPLAGRFFDPNKGQDMLLERVGDNTQSQPSIVLNETAVRMLGFKTPRDAIGKTISWARWSSTWADPALRGKSPSLSPSEVIGVVPDFTFNSIRSQIEPEIHYVDPGDSRYMVVKLSGRQIPETLRAIKRAWMSTGHQRPLPQEFENQVVQDLYKDVITQAVAIAICAGLAIFIACIGLFALAAFTTERRTKEIGVRKAMGASTFDVVRLLLWQFTQPVLWANLIAWPAAWWAMNTWLHGFAYRVDLPPWLFLAATAAAVVIAWATVSIHAFLVARARPVLALRYE